MENGGKWAFAPGSALKHCYKLAALEDAMSWLMVIYSQSLMDELHDLPGLMRGDGGY